MVKPTRAFGGSCPLPVSQFEDQIESGQMMMIRLEGFS
jgi:hypothetical protein